MLQAFFHNFFYLLKCDLTSLTPYHCQPAFAILRHYKSHNFAKILANQETRLPNSSAMSSLAITKSENLAIVTGTC